MKTIVPMPEMAPPVPKPINELIGQDHIEDRDDANRRSESRGSLRDYNSETDNCTRPDLVPHREKEKAKRGF